MGVRAQRIKLIKTMQKLKCGDPRKEQGKKLIEILDRRIAQGAKRRGRNTGKSTALDEAKAQVQVCEEQQNSVQEAARREMARHQKTMANLMQANRCNHDELTSAAGRAIQTGLELQYGDPDKEAENKLDLQDECKRTARKRSAAELGEPTEQSKRREFKKKRVDELRRLLKEAGEDSAGKKTELVERLLSARTVADAAAPAESAADEAVAASEPCPNSNADGTQRDEDLGDHGIAVAPVSEVADDHAAACDSPAGSPNHRDDAKENAARWQLPEDMELVRDDQEGEASAAAFGFGESAEGSDTEPDDAAPCSAAARTAEPAPERRCRNALNAPKAKAKTKPTPMTPGMFLNFTMSGSEEYDKEHKGKILQASDGCDYIVHCPELGDESIRVWRSPCDESYHGEKMK